MIELKFSCVPTEGIRDIIGTENEFLFEFLEDWIEDNKNFYSYKDVAAKLLLATDEINYDVACAAMVIQEDATEPELTVSLIKTNPRYENMGVATEMYNLMHSYSGGFKSVRNMVFEQNVESRGFHEKMGYELHPLYKTRWTKTLDAGEQVGVFDDINNTQPKTFSPGERWWQSADAEKENH